MSWTDDELDNIFREAAEQPVFEYQASYFQDIEKQLPIQKSRKIAWYWWTANIFIIGFVTLFFTKVWTPELYGRSAQKKSVQSKVIAVSEVNSTEQIGKDSEVNEDRLNKSQIGFTVKKQNGVVIPNKLRKSEFNVDELIPIQQPTTTMKVADEVDQVAEVNKSTFVPLNSSESNTSLTFLALSELQFDQSNRMNDPLRSFKMNKNSFYVGLNVGIEQAWTTVENVPSPMYSKGSLEFGYSRPSKSFGRHTIGFGAVGEINLFAHASHEKSVDGVRTMDANGLTNVDLFNRFGLSPKLSYSLALSEKLQIGLSLQTQLLQPLNSDRFIGEPTNLPLSGQVFLKRALKF